MKDINEAGRELKIKEYVNNNFNRKGHVLERKGLAWECQNCDAKITVSEDLKTMALSECIMFPCGDTPLSCEDVKREKVRF